MRRDVAFVKAWLRYPAKKRSVCKANEMAMPAKPLTLSQRDSVMRSVDVLLVFHSAISLLPSVYEYRCW